MTDADFEMRQRAREVFKLVLVSRASDIASGNSRFETVSDGNIGELLAWIKLHYNTNPVLPDLVETGSGVKVKVISQALLIGNESFDCVFEYEFLGCNRHTLIVFSSAEMGRGLIKTLRYESSDKPFEFLLGQQKFSEKKVVILAVGKN
jgi:hypothetical protein